ncbi:MAG: 1-deoxy-D-xylulose-5-phosphate reductoisomerase [Treponema sp.]|nr:1-deoxy-D-xylulose-5-phosphate reductoisomerase [Treponema sp.]
MKKRIAVLGATGSIGKSALDIISRDLKNFEVVLLTSRRQHLSELKAKWPLASCVQTETDGIDKLTEAIKNANADITINGISGAQGLIPSLAALESGSNLALANKETLVMAGKLVLDLAAKKNVNIIPVDSEHSAVFHLLKFLLQEPLAEARGRGGRGEEGEEKREGGENNTLREIILTASGGAFRGFSLEQMEKVTVLDALSHPTWKMGKKITIDSASMANKGLEIIEACVLFDIVPEKIKVVIHPQSIVHSMIRLSSGVIYAQLSKPDMRHPIHDALYWPQIKPSTLEHLNFDDLTLEFYKPDTDKFPMLSLAYQAARFGCLYPCAYNAANEEAVAAFLDEKIRFLDIAKVTENVLESDWSFDYTNLEDVQKADTEARKKAGLIINKIYNM